MGWIAVTVAAPSGDTIADFVLSRANNPATWSLESLGALVFRVRQADTDAFFFCPKAALVFEPLIATNEGKPCESPLVRTMPPSRSSRLVLGFRTHWEPMSRPRRKRLPTWRA